jgi:uroporphyrinogen-III synthase
MAATLEGRGANVTDLVAYRTEAETPDSPAAGRIYRMLLDGQIDAVTFTSPTAVRRFIAIIGEEQAVDLLGTTTVAAIGPVTAAAALEISGSVRTAVPAAARTTVAAARSARRASAPAPANARASARATVRTRAKTPA